jgi:hypothetical protein
MFLRPSKNLRFLGSTQKPKTWQIGPKSFRFLLKNS